MTNTASENADDWVERYRAAWLSNDPDDIRALFTEDAVYRTSPDDDDPWTGHDGIVENWLDERDEPDDWTFEWTVLAVADDLAFVQGVTDYTADDRPVYDNLWVIRLTSDGRASEFTEWWVERDSV